MVAGRYEECERWLEGMEGKSSDGLAHGSADPEIFWEAITASKNILPQIFCPKIRLTIPSDDVGT